MFRPDCFIVADFQTTCPPQRKKTTGIVEDRKKVLARSFVVNHLHITIVQ
jgi:hypothetical protein